MKIDIEFLDRYCVCSDYVGRLSASTGRMTIVEFITVMSSLGISSGNQLWIFNELLDSKEVTIGETRYWFQQSR